MKVILLCFALWPIFILNLIAQTFIDVVSLGTIPTSFGTSKFGDLDNDGDYDLVSIGSENSISGSHVYLNVNGSFVEMSDVLPKFADGDISIDLADFDRDGDLDIGVRDVRK